MQRAGIFAVLMGSVGVLAASAAVIQVGGNDVGSEGHGMVVLRDDCDPTDPAWTPTGGCTLPEGGVSQAEFGAQRLSPLAPSVIGHLAWWFDPNYLKLRAGKNIQVRNEGGRVHTFTRVASFGGGRVPPLNASQPGVPPLTPAPECLAPDVVDLPGGARDVVEGLAPGDHRFQCCIHPWMRTLVKVHEHH
jgi:plastocyanin